MLTTCLKNDGLLHVSDIDNRKLFVKTSLGTFITDNTLKVILFYFQAILNVEKAMTGAQTDLCMLGMTDSGLQVEPDTVDMVSHYSLYM